MYLHCRKMTDLTNFTDDLSKKTISELSCSAEFTRKVHSYLICFSVVNIVLSVTAFLGNALILVALHKESSLHPPSKLLYRNLAITDLCVGIIVAPLAVAYYISVVNKSWAICYYLEILPFSTGFILCSASFFTMTTISVDRLLALLLGIRYRQTVTLKRTYITVMFLWILSLFGTSTYYWNPLITVWWGTLSIPLCLVTSAFSYTKIFITLRHNQIHFQGHTFQGQPNQAVPLNIARYRKAVYSALWVQVTLVVCYLPYSIAATLTPERGIPLSLYLLRQFMTALIFLNSSLNPLLYCWKMREISQAVKDTMRELFCSSS